MFFHPAKEVLLNAWFQQALGLQSWHPLCSNHLCDHSPDICLHLEGRIHFCAASQPDTCVTTRLFSSVHCQFAPASRHKLSLPRMLSQPGSRKATAFSRLEADLKLKPSIYEKHMETMSKPQITHKTYCLIYSKWGLKASELWGRKWSVAWVPESLFGLCAPSSY